MQSPTTAFRGDGLRGGGDDRGGWVDLGLEHLWWGGDVEGLDYGQLGALGGGRVEDGIEVGGWGVCGLGEFSWLGEAVAGGVLGLGASGFTLYVSCYVFFLRARSRRIICIIQFLI